MKRLLPHWSYGGLAIVLSAGAFAQATPPAPPCTGEPATDCRPQPPKTSPADLQKSMDAAMGSMVPMMGRMAEATIDAQLRLGAMPETAERIATFKKNLFDELRKKGFTTSQAMQIVLATPLPSAGIGK